MSPKQIQARYFNRKIHQFPASELISPLLSQELEMADLRQRVTGPGLTVLDFGSGTGRLSLFFASCGFQVTAFDISQSSLSNLRSIYRQTHKPGWGQVITVSKLNPDFKADAVIGADILHHVSIPAELKKIYQTTKPGGQIIFSEPNALSPFWYLYHFLMRTPWYIESGLVNCTPAKITAFLKDAGFARIEITPHGLFPTRLFNRFPAACRFNAYILPKIPLLKMFSYRLIISARKPKI